MKQTKVGLRLAAAFQSTAFLWFGTFFIHLFIFTNFATIPTEILKGKHRKHPSILSWNYLVKLFKEGWEMLSFVSKICLRSDALNFSHYYQFQFHIVVNVHCEICKNTFHSIKFTLEILFFFSAQHKLIKHSALITFQYVDDFLHWFFFFFWSNNYWVPVALLLGGFSDP